jgi:acetyl-CoA acyltransferase
MAVGFEKMEKGSLKIGAEDREQPLMKHMMALGELYEFAMPPAPYMFGAAGREHMEKYGSTPEHFAKIGEKNHRHSANNPYAQFQDVYTLQEILDAKMVYPPLTRLQCSPTSDGSGAAVLASEEFVDVNGLADQAVEIVGQTIVTDLASTFDRRHRRRPRRLRHDQGGRPPGVRAGRPGHRRLPGDRAARLLLDQRTAHLRGVRPGR